MQNEVWMHDAQNKRWLNFSGPLEILEARRLEEVLPLLRRVEDAARRGHWAAGFVAYEAAPAFDAALETHAPGPLPLAWFGIYAEANVGAHRLPTVGADGRPPLQDWQSAITEAEYTQAITQIKEHIAHGQTYQVNFTYRLRAEFGGEPYALFAHLVENQPAPYAAFLDLGRFAICSASPELFFERHGHTVRSKPMKGTAARARTLAEDNAQACALHHSEKNRAENVMIVDMVRNDLGRVAQVGSVCVPKLFETERYPTVWQMTSTVEAETDASLSEIFGALFPCASITGAPKRSTMKIIRALEGTPRGAYCGTVGFIRPNGDAQFNVAIRTVAVDRERGTAEYGVGSGVVWDSVAAEEWAECQIKARVLNAKRPKFDLLESLKWEPMGGYWLLERHLARLKDSAAYFDFAVNLDEVRARLEAVAQTLAPAPHKVRVTVSPAGVIQCEAAPLAENGSKPLTLAIAPTPLASSNVFIFHKTTHRPMYEAARAACPEADEVVLWNERGEVTEALTNNLAVKLAGEWFTPPVACGLLAGTLRAQLLEEGQLRERVILVEELKQAEALAVFNSVRGWRVARL
jgi:para-aminobenzoate synthetase/4-amino-4-deoxychorismate lyase